MTYCPWSPHCSVSNSSDQPELTVATNPNKPNTEWTLHTQYRSCSGNKSLCSLSNKPTTNKMFRHKTQISANDSTHPFFSEPMFLCPHSPLLNAWFFLWFFSLDISQHVISRCVSRCAPNNKSTIKFPIPKSTPPGDSLWPFWDG